MDDAKLLEHLFQTIGKENRLRIIEYIGGHERSVSEIVESTGLSQPLVSHHLKTLRSKNVLITKRSGPFIYYRLQDTQLLSVLGLFLRIARSMNNMDNRSPMFTVSDDFDLKQDA